ncbi:MAG: stage III sporulation AC/AD family protein [Eubacterium sp.]|nr:stage III sporulation AC/AD family protein [Eubacterium sp.]MCM1418827.1 stage III sporulation AC/AD family protein [Roseburia sp.]
MIALTGAGIAAAVLSAILRRYNGEYGLYISLAACALILGAVLNAVAPLLSLIASLREAAGIESAYIEVLLKALAVCCMTQLASDCCRDGGEAAIASKIDFAGRIAVILLSVPLFEKLIGLIKDLIL